LDAIALTDGGIAAGGRYLFFHSVSRLSDTIMQCSTSMVGAFEAAGMLGQGRAALALVGGVESMSHVQIALGQNLSDWLRRMFQARSATQRIGLLRKLRPSDIRLFVPEVKNRVTGRSMGEHTEDMAKSCELYAPMTEEKMAIEVFLAMDRASFCACID
jgi:acetyl-CoA acetyltransferase